MNHPPKYPHTYVRADVPDRNGQPFVCRCGRGGLAEGVRGSGCAAAMRERIATLEEERDRAREDASAAVMAAAVGEAITAALNGEPVSDFMQSFGPVMEAQTIRSLLDLERRDTAVLWRVVKDACGWLHVTDDDEADWPKLPEYAKRAAEEVARLHDILTAERADRENDYERGKRDGDMEAAREVARLRMVAPRWVAATGAHRTYALRIGTCVLAAVWSDGDGWVASVSGAHASAPTLPAAARAVCERLGLPVILDGLPKEGDDV